MDLIENYLTARAAIYTHVGYVPDWCMFPIEDSTDYVWKLEGEGPNDEVRFAENDADLISGKGKCYSDSIYAQRFLKKWVYRGKDLTMVLVDTHTDGNKLLRIFDNTKERK